MGSSRASDRRRLPIEHYPLVRRVALYVCQHPVPRAQLVATGERIRGAVGPPGHHPGDAREGRVCRLGVDPSTLARWGRGERERADMFLVRGEAISLPWEATGQGQTPGRVMMQGLFHPDGFEPRFLGARLWEGDFAPAPSGGPVRRRSRSIQGKPAEASALILTLMAQWSPAKPSDGGASTLSMRLRAEYLPTEG